MFNRPSRGLQSYLVLNPTLMAKATVPFDWVTLPLVYTRVMRRRHPAWLDKLHIGGLKTSTRRLPTLRRMNAAYFGGRYMEWTKFGYVNSSIRSETPGDLWKNHEIKLKTY